MDIDTESRTETPLKDEAEPSSESASFPAEKKKFKFPGCFKKGIAFLIDDAIITAAGLLLFLPLPMSSGFLLHHEWIPWFVLGAIYFMLFQSSWISPRSVGDRVFSMRVVTLDGKSPSPLRVLGRYAFIVVPLINGDVSNTLASTLGLTNTLIGGAIYLAFIVIMALGNSVFMLFHPQKRGLFDLIFGTMVIPEAHTPTDPILDFARRPVIASVVAALLLTLPFGLIYRNAGNLDLQQARELQEKIVSETRYELQSAGYTYFSTNGNETYGITMTARVPWNRAFDKAYSDPIADRLYPAAKRFNTNPKVSTVTITFYGKRYLGLLPFSLSRQETRKIQEISP